MGINDKWLDTVSKVVAELHTLNLTEEQFVSEFEFHGYKVSDKETFLSIYYRKDYVPTQLQYSFGRFFKRRNYV